MTTTPTAAATGTILDDILRWKELEVAQIKIDRPLQAVQDEIALAPPPRDMAAALRAPGISLIAEIKRASPSKGPLRLDLDPQSLAQAYEANGASAISVLTDARFFGGSLQDLRAARQAVDLPVLRKEFVLDPYQVYEAQAAGADALLLIVAALEDAQLESLYRLTRDLGLTALIEVHDEGELQRALALSPRVVGINNRDLRTFEVHLETTERLRPAIPDEVVVVAESGIRTAADVARLAYCGVDAMLVGESLLRAQDAGAKVRELLGKASAKESP
jgi:indole-3-glycerol phosphate synthase